MTRIKPNGVGGLGLRTAPALALLVAGLLISAGGRAQSASASAATVGSPLAASPVVRQCGSGTTFTSMLGETGALVAMPYGGVLVRWRVEGFLGNFALRVLRPGFSGGYRGVGTGPTQAATSTASTTFALSVPLRVDAGDLIGFDCVGSPAGSTVGIAQVPGSSYGSFAQPLSDMADISPTGTATDSEVLVNADLVGMPQVSSVSPATGSAVGGTAVTITGSQLDEVSGVSFGNVPATSFSAVSNSTLTAVAPPQAPGIGNVPVTVTNAAGTSAPGAAIFTYTAPPPPAPGTLAGLVTDGAIPIAGADVTAVDSRGIPAGRAVTDASGGFTLSLSPGAYGVTAFNLLGDSPAVTQHTTLVSGQTTSVTVAVVALAIPAGVTASNTDRAVAWLNQERASFGLPAGIVANPVWSAACAAHDAYLSANHQLQHAETPSLPYASPGGAWAGLRSILAGTTWSAAANPWETAPIHLIQVFTPSLAVIGIDAGGYSCATTFPGLTRLPPAMPTVTTYPQNGATGFPASEVAYEAPFVPGSFVGIPEGTATGREMFVYMDAPSAFGDSRGVKITAATLTGPAGALEVRWVDNSTPTLGGYLTGGIIIPVKPLAASTAYTATAAIAGGSAATWTFTTAAAAPAALVTPARVRIPSAPQQRVPRQHAGPQRIRPRLHATPQRVGPGGATTVRGDGFAAGVVLVSERSRQGNRRLRVRATAGGTFSFRITHVRTQTAITATQNAINATTTVSVRAAPNRRRARLAPS